MSARICFSLVYSKTRHCSTMLLKICWKPSLSDLKQLLERQLQDVVLLKDRYRHGHLFFLVIVEPDLVVR